MVAILNDIIQVMTKEEVRHFKLFLNRTHTKSERKDITLFDYIRKGKYLHSERKLVGRLYGKSDRNAFYRLKNRLLDDIGKSLTLQHFEDVESGQTLNFLTLSRLFQSKGNFKVAHHYLVKAERKATESHNYELLDIIYSDYIRMSQETLNINPEVYIQNRKENRQQMARLREIDDVLAVLVYRIKLSQNFAAGHSQVVNLLQKTVDDFADQKDIAYSPQLRFKVYHAVSRILLQQHDYVALVDYLRKTIKEFEGESLFTKANHDTKLQMLTYLANALFKVGRTKESLMITKRLKVAMIEHGDALHDKYLFYYYNALVNNYSVIDTDKAIEMLNEALESKVINKVPLNRVFLYLNLLLSYFDKSEYKKANRTLVKLKLEEGFGSLDSAFRLKILIAEMIIRHELGDDDFIEFQQKGLKKEFGDLLGRPDYSRQAMVLQLLSEMSYSQNIGEDKNIQESMDQVIQELPSEEAADKDILNYHEWLKKKRKD